MKETNTLENKKDIMSSLLEQALSKPCVASARKKGQPMVAVVNSWMEMSPGDVHLKEAAKHVKEGIIKAGGFPVEIPIPGFCGEFAATTQLDKYYFAYRDFTTAMVEFFVQFLGFDGAVFLCTCDNQVPGFVMGALRVNVPSVFVTGGYMSPGIYQGKPITAFSVVKKYGSYLKGESSRQEVDEMIECACPTGGACPEMGTANTMCILTEAMGLSLPGCSNVTAGSERQNAISFASGQKVMECIKGNLRPRDIVNTQVLKNAIITCLAIGGSTNAVIHTIAYAKEIGVEIDLDTWDTLSKSTPFVCSISPNQDGRFMSDFDRSGGLPAVLKTIERILDTDVKRITGKTLKEEIKDVVPKYSEVLRSIDDPFSKDGGLIVMRGNLAPVGSILKKSSIPTNLTYFEGRARVYDSEEEAMQSVLADEVQKGYVIVVRYEGPCGCPGSREVHRIMHLLTGKGLQNDIAIITDGRLSGTNLGLAVCNVTPEAIKGTPLAIVEKDDLIRIDIANRRVDIVLPPDIIEKRLAVWQPPEPRIKEGVLALYAKNVSQYHEGARII